MGCDYNLSCRTCKKWHYLGYGPYATWFVLAGGKSILTVADWDAVAIEKPLSAQIPKNQNLRAALSEHAGHDFEIWSHDYAGHDTQGDLVMDSRIRDNILIRNHKDFERINMDVDR